MRVFKKTCLKNRQKVQSHIFKIAKDTKKFSIVLKQQSKLKFLNLKMRTLEKRKIENKCCKI